MKNDPEPSTSKQISPKKPAHNLSDEGSTDDQIYETDTDIEDCDTEDEIQRIKDQDSPGPSTSKPSPAQISPRKTANVLKTKLPKNDDGLPILPDLFKQKHFLLYGEISVGERRTLNRMITAYNGILDEYMGDKVTYVVTRSDWDENFDKAVCDHSSLVFVRPDWIYACDRQQSFTPHNKFHVVPN